MMSKIYQIEKSDKKSSFLYQDFLIKIIVD